jgi:selenocysteine lyase/cysteine desulfurase
MKITRRTWIAAAASLPFKGVLAATDDRSKVAALKAESSPAFPARSAFAPMPVIYLDSGTMHPLSLGACAALNRYVDSRNGRTPTAPLHLDATHARIRAQFAALINAKPEEICLVQSTTAGEHLVVQALNIPASGGRIVTDVLHFPGSFYLYKELSKRGMDVVWIKAKDGQRVAIEDIDAAIDRNTRLVAVSLVSTINGFQHDLKKICEIAHARGAYVYADIIHAAGALPIDVRDSGIDFAACASYKWLMGDFGLGFLFARLDVLEKIGRSQFGYEQFAHDESHFLPYDPPGREIIDYTVRNDATGHFATGTTGSACAYQLEYSLDYLSRLGVEVIRDHRLPLLKEARRELVRLGYQPMTPEESTSPLLTFAYKDAATLAPRLEKAGVKISLSRNRFRLSPSVFNDLSDIQRLIQALGRA